MKQFEFSQDDNQLFQDFNYRLLAISAIALLGVGTSFLQLVDAFTSDNLLASLLWVFLIFGHLVLAIFFFKPYDNFIKIQVTKGNDIDEFMTALEELNFGFMMFIIVDFLLVSLTISSLLGA